MGAFWLGRQRKRRTTPKKEEQENQANPNPSFYCFGSWAEKDFMVMMN
jgi:hypothetical protein